MTTPNTPNVDPTGQQEAAAPVPASQLAQDLVASGAHATPVDVEKMISELQSQSDKQQALIVKLMAERGIPADPVAAQIQALSDHLQAQANANPNHKDSYEDAINYVKGLSSKDLTEKKASKMERLVEDLSTRHSGHELAYVCQLARDLHTSTLDQSDSE